MTRLGVTFGGGGYRAAAFSLGVVHYLNDIGRLDDVVAISSVSGGSITNGFLATRLADEQCTTPGERRRQFAMLASALANQSTISFGALAGISLAIVLNLGTQIVLFSGLRSGILSRLGLALPLVVAVVTGLLLVSLVEPLVKLGLQSLLQDAGKDSGPEARRYETASMADLARSHYVPVFCATELATGTSFYISPLFVAGSSATVPDHGVLPEMVSGHAGALPLRDAMLASSAFPGLLPPQFMDSTELGLPDRKGSVLATTCLADGGLRDNLGVSFFSQWADGSLPDPVRSDLGPAPTELIVVNSGVPQRRTPRGGWFRRLRTLPLCIDAIHQSNTRRILDGIEVALRSDTSVCVVSIDDDPWKSLDQGDERQAAQAALNAMRARKTDDPTQGHTWWNALGDQDDPGVRTRLTSLGVKTAGRLMFHAYVSTMVQTAIKYDWMPPSRVPSLSDFEGLCARRTRRAWRQYGVPAWPSAQP
ncbi:MAG: patatin-like phospholipase family protein [Acidimicrobiales bacterium]